MAYFKRDRFSGTAPGVAPRLLAEQFGQVAENVDLESGRLVSIKDDSDVYTLQGGARRSIYYYRDTSWLEWDEDNVSVVPGPIPGDSTDRLYFTGAGDSSNNSDYPRVGTAATLVSGSSGYPVTSYILGIPAPSSAPTTTKSSIAEYNITATASETTTLVIGDGATTVSIASAAYTSIAGQVTAIQGGTGYGSLLFTVSANSVGNGFKLTYKTTGAVSTAPTLTGSGSSHVVSATTDETQTPSDVSYVYTFVSAMGEEGPPSPASTVFELTDTETVVVTMGSTLSGSYNFGTTAAPAGALRRIYRSNTGSTNTTFQFVGVVAYETQTFTDTVNAAALGEVLPSGTWIGPPNSNATLYPDGPLQGLIPLAQGVMAGFSGKRFCLSEPYLPHAWPISYRITTEEDIVAIASTASGVAALTDGQPYFITGTDPSAMTAIRIDLAQACINKNSVVDMGDYVLYAGPDGLCAVQSASGQVITKGLLSVSQWTDDYYPTLIRAFKHEGTYVAFWKSGSNYGGWVYDPRGDENALTTLSMTAEVRGGYMNPKDGELYIIVGNKIQKYRGGSNNKTLSFKSKKFVTPSPVSMGWVSVHANTYPATVKVWGDGTLVAHYVLSQSGSTYTQATTVPSGISNGTLREPIMRMPAVIAQEWEVQVEGTDINEFCLAQSMDEIRGL